MTDFLNVMFDLKDTAVFIYKTVCYIDDITWPRGDTKLLFERE